VKWVKYNTVRTAPKWGKYNTIRTAPKCNMKNVEIEGKTETHVPTLIYMTAPSPGLLWTFVK
jgi:hypothetical protein